MENEGPLLFAAVPIASILIATLYMAVVAIVVFPHIASEKVSEVQEWHTKTST